MGVPSRSLLLLHLLLQCSLPMKVYHLDPYPHSPQPLQISPLITVANDPIDRLPDQFAVCFSSYASLTTSSVTHKLSNWAHTVLEIRSLPNPRNPLPDRMNDGLYLRINNHLEYATMKNTGFVATESAVKALLRYGEVVVDGWHHTCTSVNSVTGDHLIVVNGEVAFNEKNEFLENTEDKKPRSAVNSTWFYGEYSIALHNFINFSAEGDKFTNLNFYSKFLSVNEAIAITSGDECGRGGDYLAWEDMELILTGEEHILQTI